MPLSGYKCDKGLGNQNLDICRRLSAQASDEFLRRGISLLLGGGGGGEGGGGGAFHCCSPLPPPIVLTQIRSNASALFA